MKDPEQEKEIRDFLSYLKRKECRWKHQNTALDLIKSYADNMLIGLDKSSTGKFLSHEELLDSMKGTLNCILEKIYDLKEMEGIPRETD